MTINSVPPVLFLVFNRPDVTARVFQRIREAGPSRLYVAADGAREDVSGEAELCERTRDAATAVDWDCSLQTLFRDRNLGLRSAVSGALDWFFENEEEGIILEDDCLPSGSFFPFCRELLDRYRENGRIMAISGVNFQFRRLRSPNSYYFSRYNHCWGWASWRRAWRFYDNDMLLWPEARREGYLGKLFDDPRVVDYWTNAFDMTSEGRVDSWAYRWTLSMWLADGLAIHPRLNMVSNIGFGKEASHTRGHGLLDSVPEKDMTFPLNHPGDAVLDRKADRRIFEICFSRSVSHRIRNRLRRLARDMGVWGDRKL